MKKVTSIILIKTILDELINSEHIREEHKTLIIRLLEDAVYTGYFHKNTIDRYIELHEEFVKKE